MRLIPLTKGFSAMVDDSDFEWLTQWRWSYIGGYARRTVKENGAQRPIRMHRFILNAPKGMRIDHVDGDSLNNTRSNLRYASHSQNMCNKKKKHNSTSQFKGVAWIPSARKRKWRAMIQINQKQTHLGYFADEVDAARAYDAKAKELHGQFARLNFPA